MKHLHNMSVPPRIATRIRPLQVTNHQLPLEVAGRSQVMQVFARCDPLALLGGDPRDWLDRLVTVCEQAAGLSTARTAAVSQHQMPANHHQLQARWLAALAALPRDGVPAFALVQVRTLAADEPAVSAVAVQLALVLLAQSGGSVFSRLRAPVLPERAWLDRSYSWLAYVTPAVEVGYGH